MLLRVLEIKNYRSLEDVRLSGIDRFNVLVGRNNSGKSSVFGALQFLSGVLFNGYQSSPDSRRVLFQLDATRPLEIRLTFEPRPHERQHFIGLMRLDQRDPASPGRLFESQFLRKVSYFFRSLPGDPNRLHLRETKLTSEEGDWAVVQRMTGSEYETEGTSEFLNFRDLNEYLPSADLYASTLDIDQVRARAGSRITPDFRHQYFPFQASLSQEPGSSWLREQLVEYLRSAFFFDPFRRSEPVLEVSEKYKLSQNGSDLARVLNILKTNEDEQFAQIKAFVEGALPDIGDLRPRTFERSTRVHFRSALGGYETRLHEMGGGVEQLLMAAVVLVTTGDESTLFLEEPESHLHAGAQRYLIEKLYEGERQVFITTHSPTFVNQSMPKSIYRVTLSGGSTSVSKVQKEAEFADVLEDIGVRNSDVLLSDAVLFVEGEADGDALSAWAEKLGLGFAERNIAVLPMGGGEYVARGARPRVEVLEGISTAAPVPHVFVVDHDERPASEIEKLGDDLGNRIHVLEKRELENYLLIPGSIRAALRSKHAYDDEILKRLEDATEGNIEALIEEAVDNLRGRVLLNRVRAELPGLKGGLMDRIVVASLEPHADEPDLHEMLRRALEGRVAGHLSDFDLGAVVQEQRELLDRDWSDPEKRVDLAPGTEVLERVFGYFGSRYRKTKDASRIAESMNPEQIAEELRIFLGQVVALTDYE